MVEPRSRRQTHLPPPFTLQALRSLEGGWGAGWGLRPSPVRRQWMSRASAAYQCLPMVVANQWGWQVLCPTDVRVTWDGSPDPDGLRVEVDPQCTGAIKSQFGQGIVTFSPPWLFRTPPGWDLYAKGPSNRWKPNCVPLEGVIETWWLNYTFTLNWKVVEPGVVTFARGESLGQLVPVPHATFQDALARESPLGAVEPEAAAELLRWLPSGAGSPASRQDPPPLPQGRGDRGPPHQGPRPAGSTRPKAATPRRGLDRPKEKPGRPKQKPGMSEDTGFLPKSCSLSVSPMMIMVEEPGTRGEPP